MKSFSGNDIVFHKAVDHVDPGFSIRGHKLRWVSGAVESRRAGRMWRTLKLSHLSKEAQAKFKEINPTWEDGDTIRRRGLLLSYASLDEVKVRSKDLKDSQDLNEAVFRGKRSAGGHATSTGKTETKVVKSPKAEDFGK